MEGSSDAVEGPMQRDTGTERMTQVGLLLASLGAVLVVFNLFGLAILGLFLAVAGAVMAARGGSGRVWFTAVAAGAVLSVLSRLIAEEAETLGGWLAVAASLLILIGASLGFPLSSDTQE